MNHKIKKKPWPTQKAMIQIYEKKLWGISDTNTDFYSGEGSHKNEFVAPYLTHIISFLKSFNPPLRLLDLGCGDFNIGDKLTPYTASYTGVDIVPKLIERNQKIYQNKKVTFKCLDIAKDVLPVAHDCVIVRQVLQHLSNTEIKAVLPKLSKYKYLILTEHIPAQDFVPNLDIISGQGIRLKKKSGVDITKPPFSFKVKTEILSFSTPLPDPKKGKIHTSIYIQ